MSNGNTSGVVSSGYSSTSNTTLNTNLNQDTLSNGTKLNEHTASTNNNSTSTTNFASFVTGGGGNPISSNDNDQSRYKSYESKLYSNHMSCFNKSELNKTDKLGSPFVNDEKLAYEVLSKAGPAYTYQRKDYSHDIGALQCESNNSSTSSYHDFSNNPNLNKSSGMYEYDDHANVIRIEPNKNLYSSSATIINQDPDPITVRKANNQNIVYKQQVNIRYLQPPTPPPPAPIIIREKQCAPQPPLPPIIIRFDFLRI